MELPYAEPYKIRSTDAIYKSSVDERKQWLEEAHFNLYNLTDEQVYLDLLSDSSSSTSDQENVLESNESYSDSKSYYKMAKSIKYILGFDYFLPTHHGKGAKSILHSYLTKSGDVIPGNVQIDTKRADYWKATAIDCTVVEAPDTKVHHDFTGNIDLNKLKNVLHTYKEKVPVIVVTVTCKSLGGHPVSMENLKNVSDIAKDNKIPLCIDGARFAENAYFIKLRESGYQDKTLQTIVAEMFSHADFVTLSAKKDIMAGTGGFLAFRNKEHYVEVSKFAMLYGDFVTYSGLTGRDMEDLAQGLIDALQWSNLEPRIKQIEYLAAKLKGFEIPFKQPVGGHAVYIDAGKMLQHIPKEEFPALTLNCELYFEAGVRGKAIEPLFQEDTSENGPSKSALLRLAIPKRCYTNSHMEYVAVALHNVMKRCSKHKRGVEITSKQKTLRYSTVELKPIKEDKESEKKSSSSDNCKTQ